MKILNSPNYREIPEDEEVEQKTAVSELPLTSELRDKSLIHIVQFIQDDKYESQRMEINTFESKIYEAVQNTFKSRYAETHNDTTGVESQTDETHPCPPGASFKELLEYLADTSIDGRDWSPIRPNFNNGQDTEPDLFAKHIFYDFNILKRYVVKKDEEILGRVSTINYSLSKIDYAFADRMTISTTDQYGGYTNESVNHLKSENDSYCQLEISPGNKISNKWTVPADGQLVVYGWLDSNKALNNKAIPSAYCVLEANINNEWEIIAVQQVNPAKNFTYVGFNVPVHQGLVIRARTGFPVGAKSSQYANEQDGYDSLSNSTANGFKCQVYSHKSYKTYDE